MLFYIGNANDRQWLRAYIMCFDRGETFGFRAVLIAHLPFYMQMAKLTNNQRMEMFKHQFLEDGHQCQFKLFAYCENGKSSGLHSLMYTACPQFLTF